MVPILQRVIALVQMIITLIQKKRAAAQTAVPYTLFCDLLHAAAMLQFSYITESYSKNDKKANVLYKGKEIDTSLQGRYVGTAIRSPNGVLYA